MAHQPAAQPAADGPAAVEMVSAAELEQLGTAFRVARTDLRWNLVQPAGPGGAVDWGGYDRLLDSLQRVRRPTPRPPEQAGGLLRFSDQTINPVTQRAARPCRKH